MKSTSSKYKIPGTFAGETRGILPILATSFAGAFASCFGGAAD
jgi:hypothetical protein